MYVLIKNVSGDIIKIYVIENENIESVKLKIQEKDGILFELQRIIFNGRVLDDSRSLKSYGIINESVLYLVIRLRRERRDFNDL
jgi:ubiquitin-like protein Nedd8